MLVRAGSADLLHTPVFTDGASCNFLKPSLAEHGFDPDDLQNAPAQRIRSELRPWRDLWSAGQGVGLVDDVPTVAELVARLRREYREQVPAA
jgi:nitronate monooxygenase